MNNKNEVIKMNIDFISGVSNYVEIIVKLVINLVLYFILMIFWCK